MLGASTEQVKTLGLFGYPSIISIATILTGSFFLFDRNLEASDTLNLLYSCSTIFVLFLMTCIIWYFATILRKIKLPKLPLRAPNKLNESKNGQEYTPLVTDVWIIKNLKTFFFKKFFLIQYWWCHMVQFARIWHTVCHCEQFSPGNLDII